MCGTCRGGAGLGRDGDDPLSLSGATGGSSPAAAPVGYHVGRTDAATPAPSQAIVTVLGGQVAGWSFANLLVLDGRTDPTGLSPVGVFFLTKRRRSLPKEQRS